MVYIVDLPLNIIANDLESLRKLTSVGNNIILDLDNDEDDNLQFPDPESCLSLARCFIKSNQFKVPTSTQFAEVDEKEGKIDTVQPEIIKCAIEWINEGAEMVNFDLGILVEGELSIDDLGNSFKSNNDKTWTNEKSLQATAIWLSQLPRDRVQVSITLYISPEGNEHSLSLLDNVKKIVDVLRSTISGLQLKLMLSKSKADDSGSIIDWMLPYIKAIRGKTSTEDYVWIILSVEYIIPLIYFDDKLRTIPYPWTLDDINNCNKSSIDILKSWRKGTKLSLKDCLTLKEKGLELVSKGQTFNSEDNINLADDVVEGFISCLRTDRDDGLYSTVVTDECGIALGLVYSSKDSVRASFTCQRGVYFSRSRNSLWRKGDTSGAWQALLAMSFDCDQDALRFSVIQHDGGTGGGASFCHFNRRTCWGRDSGLGHLERVLFQRKVSAPEGSYTKRLFLDRNLLRNKLLEEAQELIEAEDNDPDHVAAEAADLIYFAMVRCVAADVKISDIEKHLDLRQLKIKRRPGNAKAYRIATANEILQKDT